MDLSIVKLEEDDEDVKKYLLESLVSLNDKKAGSSGYTPLTFSVQDGTAEVVGGLSGRTAYGWLFVELLFVAESLRGQGIGASLMRKAEKEALKRNCHSAWVDTFGFQAPEFYSRLGYQCFGQLADYPKGYTRYYLKKELI